VGVESRPDARYGGGQASRSRHAMHMKVTIRMAGQERRRFFEERRSSASPRTQGR
jgi:hypothetical protein